MTYIYCWWWFSFFEIDIQQLIHYLINSAGSNLQRLNDHSAVNLRPEWSPDGRQLGFHTTRDYGSVGGSKIWDEFEIYIMNLNDHSIQRLTKNKSFDAHPVSCPKK